MPIVDPVTVINTIKPRNNNDFGLIEDVDFIGGFRVAASIAERDAIPTDKLKVGAFVFVQANSTLYRATSLSPLTFAEFSGGGGGGGDEPVLVPTAPIGSLAPVGATSAFDIAIRGNTIYLLSNADARLFAIDVTNPAAPTFLGSIATDSTPRALVTQGNFVYVVGDTAPGRNFQVYDVRNPASIVRRNGALSVNQSQGLTVQGRLAAAGDRGGGLRIFDLSDPTSPEVVASFGSGFPSQGLTFAGSLLLSANPNTSDFQVWDVSDPTAPVVLSTLGTFSSPRAIRALNKYAFVLVNGDSSVKIIDIDTPATPVLVASVPTVASPNCFDVQGNVLYVGGTDGISVHDITDPNAALLVGTILVTGIVRGVVAIGGYLYAAVATAPYFQVFQISERFSRIVQAGGVSAEKLDVRGESVLNDARLLGGLSVGASALISGDLAVERDFWIAGATQGSVFFAGVGGALEQDNAAFFWNATNKALGLGTVNPSAGDPTGITLHASRSGSAANAVFSSFNAVSAAATSTLTIARGRGTNAAPTAVLTGDVIGSLFFAGQTDTTPGNFSSGARFRAVALENFTGSTRGTTLFLDVAGIGGVPNERASFSATGFVFNDLGAPFFMRIEGDLDPSLLYVDGVTDRVAVGTSSPSYKFHVFSALLDQRIVSQTSNTTGVAYVSASTGPLGAPDQQISLVAYGATAAGTTMGFANADAVGVISAVPSRMFVTTPVVSNAPIIFGPNTIETLTLNAIAGSTGFVFNETGIDLDARFEGVGRISLLHLDAALGRVGINRTAGAHGATLDVDNVAVAESIFIARDNGVPVFTIGDASLMTFGEALNIALGTATGTKIGTSATQKLGFFNATPVVQPTGIADATGGATIDAEARAAVNAIISRLENLGLLATV